MAALDFPDNPTNGQVFDKWTWNGTMWVLTASGSGGGGSGFTFNQDATPTATKVGDTWYETDTGDSFVWTNDGNSTQWVQFAPGSGGGGGSGFTYVTDTTPTPSKVGDTWFDTSTLASGGTSWLAIEESPGGEKVWVQFAPGSGLANGPRGVMAQARLSVDTVSLASIGDVPGWRCDWTGRTGRTYKTTLHAYGGIQTGAGAVEIYLADGGGAKVAGTIVSRAAGPTAAGIQLSHTLTYTGADQPLAYKAMYTCTGGCTFVMYAGTTNLALLLVEDIGAV